MEKLPVTSYVRLVDIWLIFGQLIPFIEVTTLYSIFRYSKREEPINLKISFYFQGGFGYNSRIV